MIEALQMDPECAHLIGILIHEILDEEIGDVDAVGGLELGAVPLTGVVIAKSSKGSNPEVSLFVRRRRGEEEERLVIRQESKARP